MSSAKDWLRLGYIVFLVDADSLIRSLILDSGRSTFDAFRLRHLCRLQMTRDGDLALSADFSISIHVHPTKSTILLALGVADCCSTSILLYRLTRPAWFQTLFDSIVGWFLFLLIAIVSHEHYLLVNWYMSVQSLLLLLT